MQELFAYSLLGGIVLGTAVSAHSDDYAGSASRSLISSNGATSVLQVSAQIWRKDGRSVDTADQDFWHFLETEFCAGIVTSDYQRVRGGSRPKYSFVCEVYH